MIIGVPKEIKTDEYRVAVTPAGAEVLAQSGHRVFVESGAGDGSGYPDARYAEAGAEIAGSADDVWHGAELIVKVKEPQPAEIARILPGHILFTYLHLAASPELTRALLDTGATCVAYETVRDSTGRLPLLMPMSEIAGRLAVQEAAKHLEKPMGGRGVLLGAVTGVAPGHVTIIGGGTVGAMAAKVAAGIGASVAILEVSLDRLRHLEEVMPPNVMLLHTDPPTLREQLAEADALIGAVLVPGAKAPRVVKREHLRLMKPGAVIVDVAVDQGGCVETIRPTTHRDPTYVVDGIVHYGVANMPGAVSRTSTQALTNATLPYVQAVADHGIYVAASRDPGLAAGIDLRGGQVVCQAVADAMENT